MTIEQLESDISVILSSLRVDYKKMSVIKEVSVQFIVEEFGTIICGLNRADYLLVSKTIEKQFGSGWRIVYLSLQDSLLEKKDEVIWDLMRGGYIRYIRNKYPRQFRELIVMQNFGRKIIEQRLKVWNNEPKFNFLIEENKAALKEAFTYILSIDPSFFDYMP